MRPSYVYSARIATVIDGDTLDAEIDLGFRVWTFERIRLNNIDTPEMYGSRAGPAGLLAKRFAQDWVQAAGRVYLHSMKYDHREKYGRVLGDFYRTMPDGADDPVPLGVALRAAGHIKTDG